MPLCLPASVEAERYFDEDLADRYELFFPELLKCTEGEMDQYGQPLYLAEEPWRQAIRECMGWRVKKTGARWYRQLYIYIPRKNGKTTTIAGLTLSDPDHRTGGARSDIDRCSDRRASGDFVWAC